MFLQRGVYLSPLNREKLWKFQPTAKIGTSLSRGETFGIVFENNFSHSIMVPFSKFGRYTLTWLIEEGNYPIETVVAKAIDENGLEHEFTMLQKWPIKNPLCEGEKISPSKMLSTGCRIIDTQFPLIKGGTFCTPGPFGAGKTVLQHHLSKFSAVDIVIICACGERAGEVVELLKEFPHLIDPHTNESLMQRTILICNTSSMPVAARESSIYMGVTIAEYYRQMGLDVLLLADSTSRWAQALREISGRLEEIPGDEAFPAYLSSRIAQFYERSGVISLPNGQIGSLTIGGSVSPAGGNFEEPVTQATLSVVGAFLGLSRDRSDSRRYPAIDPLISWSKYLEQTKEAFSAKAPNWSSMVNKASYILKLGNEIGKRMEVIGEEGVSISDLVIYLKSEFYDFCYLQQNSFDVQDAFCSIERQLQLFLSIHHILESSCHFKNHDEARQFFQSLQSIVKNMNYLPFPSEEFDLASNKVEALLQQVGGGK